MEESVHEGTTSTTSDFYDAVAVIIFVLVSFNFLFPSNFIFPLDRRTVAVFGAVVCFATRRFLFPSNPMDVHAAIDYDVLMLLAAIMAINFIIVNITETKQLINRLQNEIKSNPERGFWYISFAAFICSPFLTNDGVCLLMVEPITRAFEHTFSEFEDEHDGQKDEDPMRLESTDCIYFLLSLACSANIGSALTYTGNPQNMIVSQDALSVMSPGLFLAYQILPSTFSWFVTTFWILLCWRAQKKRNTHTKMKIMDEAVNVNSHDGAVLPLIITEDPVVITGSPVMKTSRNSRGSRGSRVSRGSKGSLLTVTPAPASPISPKPRKVTLSPRQRRLREEMLSKVPYVVNSPIPKLALVILMAMVIAVFMNVISIAAVVCITAIVMVIAIVVGNHYTGKPVWGREDGQESPQNREERSEVLQDFFEALFTSIDYSLLLIFLGTFVVVGNLESTGIPNRIWSRIVGNSPFNTVRSVFGISMFVLISSQLLGNVAVCQLARPNVEVLDAAEKKYAWAVISFVATIGGNLTITGSAANIIVAEKVARLDPQSSIDFFKHYHVCFWITLTCCVIGAVMITCISVIESGTSLVW